MDAEWKKIIAQSIYGAITVVGVILAFATQNLVISGTTAFIGAIVLLYAENIVRKILKKATGITDKELDDIKEEIKPLAEPTPEPVPEPTPT